MARALGDIGHDIKNMLTPVQTGVDFLREEIQEVLGRLAMIGEGAQVETSRKMTEELIDMIVNNTRRIQDRVRELADAVKGVTTGPEFKPCLVSTCVAMSSHRYTGMQQRKGSHCMPKVLNRCRSSRRMSVACSLLSTT